MHCNNDWLKLDGEKWKIFLKYEEQLYMFKFFLFRRKSRLIQMIVLDLIEKQRNGNARPVLKLKLVANIDISRFSKW